MLRNQSTKPEISFTNDEADEESEFSTHHSESMKKGESKGCRDDGAWVLGVKHRLETGGWREDIEGFLWYSYRSGFPAMVPYLLTSDSGWGCMLRAAQMLMANGLLRHSFGRHWKPPFRLEDRRRCVPYISVLRAFVDLPGITHVDSDRNKAQHYSDAVRPSEAHSTRVSKASTAIGSVKNPSERTTMSTKSMHATSTDSELADEKVVYQGQLFSIHNMVRMGLAFHNKFPGEWYGPAAASHILRDISRIGRSLIGVAGGRGMRDILTEREKKSDLQYLGSVSSNASKEKKKSNVPLQPLAVVVSQEDVVYVDQILAVVEEKKVISRVNKPITQKTETGSSLRFVERKIDWEENGSQCETQELLNRRGDTETTINDILDKKFKSRLEEIVNSTTPTTLRFKREARKNMGVSNSQNENSFFDPLFNAPFSPASPRFKTDYEEEGRQINKREGIDGKTKGGDARHCRANDDQREYTAKTSGDQIDTDDVDETAWPEWSSSLLLLVPVRLGLGSLNEAEYGGALIRLLEFPQSLGFIGGRPNHALWFVGYRRERQQQQNYETHHSNRSRKRTNVATANTMVSTVESAWSTEDVFLMGLDPHTTQAAIVPTASNNKSTENMNSSTWVACNKSSTDSSTHFATTTMENENDSNIRSRYDGYYQQAKNTVLLAEKERHHLTEQREALERHQINTKFEEIEKKSGNGACLNFARDISTPAIIAPVEVIRKSKDAEVYSNYFNIRKDHEKNDRSKDPQRLLAVGDAIRGKFESELSLSDDYLMSCHANFSSTSDYSLPFLSHGSKSRPIQSSVALSHLDPSLALGFYVRDRHDFEDFRRRLRDLSEQLKEHKDLLNKARNVVTQQRSKRSDLCERGPASKCEGNTTEGTMFRIPGSLPFTIEEKMPPHLRGVDTPKDNGNEKEIIPGDDFFSQRRCRDPSENYPDKLGLEPWKGINQSKGNTASIDPSVCMPVAEQEIHSSAPSHSAFRSSSLVDRTPSTLHVVEDSTEINDCCSEFEDEYVLL